MAIPSSPDDPSKGTKLSCTLERQCSFFTAVLDMANELRREREQDRRVSRRCETRKKRKCQLHNKLGNDPVTSRRRLFCYLTFVGCQCLRPGELQRFTSERVKKDMNNSNCTSLGVFSETSGATHHGNRVFV